MNDVADEAQSIRAPSGVFGTQWLMSESEVKRVIPNAEPDGPGSLIEFRYVYERDAKISYGFQDDYLLIVVVTFLGKASESQYHEVQKRLTADYGPLSEPALKGRFNLYSERQVGRFKIEHVLYGQMGASIEQVSFYRKKVQEMVNQTQGDITKTVGGQIERAVGGGVDKVVGDAGKLLGGKEDANDANKPANPVGGLLEGVLRGKKNPNDANKPANPVGGLLEDVLRGKKK